jgi:glycosyltransferase involved in cell wall biosynthesis
MPNTLIFAAIIPYLFGKKMILDEHDTMPETYLAKFENKRGKAILKKLLETEESICCRMADKVICVNHVQEEALLKRNIPKNKTLIHMNLPDPKGVNHETPIKKSPGTDGIFKLCYHGTITNRLGIDLAVRAVKKVEGEIPRLELHIFGGGEGIDECIAVSKELGLQKCVHFRGIVQFEKLIPIITEMDLGIIPNRKNEATELMLPVKMLEYVALGIPVVCPGSRAIKYYFSDDMVFYYNTESIESMSDAIVLAYNNREFGAEKAENARKFFKEYGWEKQNKDLVDMYNNMAELIKI